MLFKKNQKGLYEFELESLKVEGRSVAGVETFVSIPNLKFCIDVGYSHPSLWTHNYFFISHCHMDHAAGIPYLISSKALNNQKPPVFYMPEYMISPMKQIMEIWSKMEGHQYEYEFLPSEGLKLSLNPVYFVRSFPTTHRVISNGYCLFQNKKQLKEKYKGLSQQEILAAKERGEELESSLEKPLLAVTCDTTLDFLKEEPWVATAKCLLIETTYIDSKKPPEEARKWGHIHLEDMIKKLPELQNDHIILKHLSRRYTHTEVVKQLQQKLPEEFKTRVSVLPW